MRSAVMRSPWTAAWRATVVVTVGRGRARPAQQRPRSRSPELGQHLIGERRGLDRAALLGQHDGPVAVDHGGELVAADPFGQTGRGVEQLLGGLEVAEGGVEADLGPSRPEAGAGVAVGLDERLDASPRARGTGRWP